MLLWDINYVDGKGFTLKNVYTGKYLKDALSAKYDEPTYFTFCTLGYKTTGISIVNSDERDVQEGVYDLSGRRIAKPTKAYTSSVERKSSSSDDDSGHQPKKRWTQQDAPFSLFV